MSRLAAVLGLALLASTPCLADVPPGYAPELQEGGWILLRHEDADGISYLLQAQSRDGGQTAEMVCSATLQGEQPPSLVLVGKGTGKAEISTLGPTTSLGELEITDGKAPLPLWQAPAELEAPGNLSASLADLKGLRLFLSAAGEAKLSLVVHADFQKRDLRAVYDTPPPSITARLLERCASLHQWVDSHRPAPETHPETPAEPAPAQP